MAFLRFEIVMAILALGGFALAQGFVYLINFLFANPDNEHVICFYDRKKDEKFFLQGGLRIKLDHSVYWSAANAGRYDWRQDYAELVESTGVSLDEALTEDQEIRSCLLDVNEKRVLERVNLTAPWPYKPKY